jgi:DUF4097 and DUF4098 domain-containing protein YvlB
MKQLLFITALGLVGWGLGTAQTQSSITRDGAYWVRTIQGVIDASSSGRLRVETTGNVTLRGSGGEQTTYTLAVRVRASDAREAEALLDRINVKTGTEGGWASIKVTPPRRDSSGMELSVTGPRALRQVRAETQGGNVQGSEWDGDFEAQSAGGRITVDRIRGRSELRTAGGDLEVGNVSGPVRCFSGGGAIRVDSAGAAVWLETAGGEILVHQAGGPVQASTGGGNIRIERAASTVLARTAGGLIQVQQADGPVTAESSGGAIQVNSANGVRCESAGGAIRLRNVAGAVHAFANSGSIMAELVSGSGVSGHAMANSVLSANAGDITVLIPSNLALTIQAINESGGSGRINSDFPQVRPQPGGMPGVGPQMAEGALNGGGPLLRVNVVAGTIYLRRAK